MTTEHTPEAVVAWLVRHGETVWNEAGRIAGWTDVELTESGRAQASALGEVLCAETFDSVRASDLRRAIHTSELAWGPPAHVDPRLRELDFGEMDGLDWHTCDPVLRNALLDLEGFRAPGGEHIDELRARVFSVLDELPPGRHLIFTHAGVIRVILHEVGDDRFLQPASLAAVDWTARRLLFFREGG